MSKRPIYVSDLESDKVLLIEKSLRKEISAMGLYSEKEVKQLVKEGLDSKIADLTDTIPVYDILNK